MLKFNTKITVNVHLSVLEDILYSEIKNRSNDLFHPNIKLKLTTDFFSFYNNTYFTNENMLLAKYCDKFSKLFNI